MKSGDTIKKTSRQVRPELVNKWPNSIMLDYYYLHNLKSFVFKLTPNLKI
jgi:hypothetical protein